MDWFQLYLVGFPLAFVVGIAIGLIMIFRKKGK